MRFGSPVAGFRHCLGQLLVEEEAVDDLPMDRPMAQAGCSAPFNGGFNDVNGYKGV